MALAASILSNPQLVINNKSSDEIGHICRSFDNMRKKLKESVEQKERYEENRKELLSNISHDLKTPITSIKGYVEGIIDGVADTPEMVDKYIKTIHQKSIHMDKQIDDLFMFSKLDIKKLPFDYHTVNIKKYFEDIMEELSVDLSNKHFTHTLHIEFDGDIFARIDRNKLRRVVLNIVENAVKYSDKIEKKIDIIIRDQGDFVEIEMMDNGKGIQSEDLAMIFERFYRTNAARTSEAGGSGLGLPISKQIIEFMGGTIYAKSVFGETTSIIFMVKKTEELDDEKNIDH